MSILLTFFDLYSFKEKNGNPPFLVEIQEIKLAV